VHAGDLFHLLLVREYPLLGDDESQKCTLRLSLLDLAHRIRWRLAGLGRRLHA